MSVETMNIRLGVPYRIEEIVAHEARMQLLDELVSYNEEQIVVAVTVRDTSQFCVPGVGVPAWVGIEYMAQAVGAFSGIEDVQAGGKPQIGLLLGSRRYRCSVQSFPLGARLIVTANLKLRDAENLVAFHCEIERDGAVLAQADLKAVLPDDVDALVRAQS
jgi:predicted hotdog family 3-hydroxylacyl-ACP dehydratase